MKSQKTEIHLCMNCMKELDGEGVVTNKYGELFCSEACVSEFEKENNSSILDEDEE
jgi:hypothetical protein